MCGCILHNLILDHYSYVPNDVDREDAQYNMLPGAWRQEQNLMERLMSRKGSNYTRQAKVIRDYLAFYYASEAGAVPWQERLVYPRGGPADV